jgi:hypothetical protein
MEDENKPLTHEEMGEIASAFMEVITEEAIKREIPAFAVVGIFGLFTRKVIEVMVEQGKDRDQTIMDMVKTFMDGVGLDAIFQKLQTAKGVH